MPTVNIKDVGTVNFPDDYTPERIQFAIENDILPRVKKAPAVDSGIKPEKPSALVRLGRGFADVAQGVKQLGLTAKDALTGRADADAYTKEKTEELALYEKGRGPDAGVDWMRLGGNVLATAPAALIPGAGAATLGLRMASGAAQGAAASGSMFTPEGESKLSQVLIGAGMGAAFPAVLEGGRRAISALGKQIQSGVTVDLPKLQGELTMQLQQKGVDFNKLTSDVQKSLLDDAQRALKIGGDLDAAQLARKVDIESVGAKGTQAAVTRNPKDWRTMQNLRGVDNAGEGIAKRQADDAGAMVDYLARLRGQTGGKAATAYDAGESAVGAIRAQDAAKEKVVTGLYDAYRATGGATATVPPTRLADTLGRVADEFGVENIPAPVLNRLKEFGLLDGKQTKLLTVNEADKLNRLINNNNPGRGTPGARALQPIKEALNESLLDIPERGASKALLDARAAAAQRFSEQRAAKGIEAAVDDVAPDRFVKRFILDADARDLRGTLNELKKSPQGQQAIADIKGHLFDQLLLKATGATSADDVAGRAFSGRSFAKALDAIPPEKLHQLFSPSEVESLRTLQRASKYLTEEVPFSDVNHSKTAAALANLLQKIGSTPMVGQILSPIIGVGKIGMDWVKDAAQRKAVAEMLVTSAAQPAKAAARQLSAPNTLTRLAPAALANVGQRLDDESE